MAKSAQVDRQLLTTAKSRYNKIRRKYLLYCCKLCPDKQFAASAHSKSRKHGPTTSVEKHVEIVHAGMDYKVLVDPWGYRVHYDNVSAESLQFADRVQIDAGEVEEMEQLGHLRQQNLGSFPDLDLEGLDVSQTGAPHNTRSSSGYVDVSELEWHQVQPGTNGIEEQQSFEEGDANDFDTVMQADEFGNLSPFQPQDPFGVSGFKQQDSAPNGKMETTNQDSQELGQIRLHSQARQVEEGCNTPAPDPAIIPLARGELSNSMHKYDQLPATAFRHPCEGPHWSQSSPQASGCAHIQVPANYASTFRIALAPPASATHPSATQARSTTAERNQVQTPTAQKRKVTSSHPQTPTPKTRRARVKRVTMTSTEASAFSLPNPPPIDPAPRIPTISRPAGNDTPLSYAHHGPVVFPQMALSKIHPLDQAALVGQQGGNVANLVRLAFFGHGTDHATHPRTREEQMMDMIGYLRLQRGWLVGDEAGHGGVSLFRL